MALDINKSVLLLITAYTTFWAHYSMDTAHDEKGRQVYKLQLMIVLPDVTGIYIMF